LGYPVVLIVVPAITIALIGLLLPRSSRAVWIGATIVSSLAFFSFSRDFAEGSPFDAGMFLGFVTISITVTVLSLRSTM